MFSGATNPYEEIVDKTTDENLTSENWELILNLCDKVTDEGPAGAKNVMAAVLKRLAHRNSNVQLYALSLAEALGKNCTIDLHREIASKSFTSGLENIVTARTTHEKVKQRALTLVAMWTGEFESDESLGIMEECYNNLKAKGYKFEAPQEAPPPTGDDEARRKEEEELQRVLEMSIQDSRMNNWQSRYSPVAAVASTSSSSMQGYSPAPPRVESPVVQPAVQQTPIPMPQAAPTPAPTATGIVTRVRALHTFTPTEAGELAFDKGDVIKVVDRGYKDWWRGQLKGRTGIFPVNYVESLPEPTSAELAREAEKEADVFAQAANVDRLLTMLKGLDPAKDNLADNEEIQELYRSSMVLRPKIVKLIDKYSQKKADLVSMNETFVRARTIFERMMEESLARQGVYDGGYSHQPQQQQQQYVAWNQYAPGYPQTPGGGFPHPQPQPGGYQQPQQAPGTPGPYQPPQPQQGPPQGPQQPQYAPEPQPYGASPYPQQPQGPSPNAQMSLHGQPGAAGPQQHAPDQQQQQQQQGPTPAPGPHEQHGPVPGFPGHPQPATEPQQQPAQSIQTQPQPTQSQTPVPQPQPPTAGPPYVYDPKGTYEDANATAWAAYYAQGGKDLAGAVYFISIPGVTDGAPPAPAPVQLQVEQVQAGQSPTQANRQPSSPTSWNQQPQSPGGLGAGGFPGPVGSYIGGGGAGSPGTGAGAASVYPGSISSGPHLNGPHPGAVAGSADGPLPYPGSGPYGYSAPKAQSATSLGEQRLPYPGDAR